MADLAGVLARAVVGGVLLASGALKLRAPSWPAAAAAFGTPRALVPALPWAELVTGACLVAQLGVPWTPLVALVMLAAFTAAVAVRLRRGERPPCGCFGAASAEPVGPATLARNAALGALALLGAVA